MAEAATNAFSDTSTIGQGAHGDRHFDVLVIGAGLSGIGAAYHLQKHFPDKSYAVLEGRGAIGGTWDLFRYPGIRSDSDMFTLGYRFRPWKEAKAIADGPSIRAYVNDTAREYGIDERIIFNQWVTKYAWSSEDALWTVEVGEGASRQTYTCNFVWNCAGYYRYSAGYTPDFPGAEEFSGEIVHPQQWPEDLNYEGKSVVVIGSGATAVTLIPSMADKTAHITMLQRSPTYMFAMPGTSPTAKFLNRLLPKSWTYRIMRWLRICLQQLTFNLARARPEQTRENLLKQTTEKLKPGYDVETHFSPDYNPWDQRICLVPDDDLFQVINDGKASVVTDHIDRFTKTGILLKSGEELDADIIVTATGLTLEALGGASVTIDGETINLADKLTYKGLMFEDVPNFASVFGYTNASWTLRADLVSDFVCRLMKETAAKGADAAVPRNHDPDMERVPFLDFTSGYVKRAEHILPKQGDAPWRHPQNYFMDMLRLRHGKIDDGILEFQTASPHSAQAPTPVPAAAE